MGKKHDDIVSSLTKEKLKELLANDLYGEKACWRLFHPNEAEGFTLNQLKKIVYILNANKPYPPISEIEDYTYRKFEEVYIDKQSEICEINKKNDDIEIIKELERPIIKGNGEYRCTKGYLDIFVNLRPFSNGLFSSYKSNEEKFLVIEVKTLKDFDDTGSIIRQLNEYKEYFKPFRDYWKDRDILWYIYCDENIPEQSKQMLIDSGYKILGENNKNDKDNENK